MRRRTLLLGGALSAASLLGGARGWAAGPPLRVVAWSEVFSPRILRDFRFSTGLPVEVDVAVSSEDLLRRLSRESSGVDLVLAPDYLIPLLRDRELLRPLEKDRLHHLAELDPRLETRPDDPGHRFSVPFLWGTTGLGWRSDRVEGGIDSWAEALDPSAPWAGHVSLVGDAREALGAALKALGRSVNTTDPQHVRDARDLLILQPRLSVLSGDAVAGRLAFGASSVSQVWSDDVARLRRQGVRRVSYALPKEGGMLWIDALGIVATSPRVDDAHAFLDYLGHPRTAGEVSAELGQSSPNLRAAERLPRALRADPAIQPPWDRLDRSEFIRDVGPAIEVYDEVWADVLRAAGVRGGVR